MDCLRRVLAGLKHEAFSRCFVAWVADSLSIAQEGRPIAVDGKTLRRSHDKKNALGRCMESVLAADDRPNLIFILTDDHRRDQLGC